MGCYRRVGGVKRCAGQLVLNFKVPFLISATTFLTVFMFFMTVFMSCVSWSMASPVVEAPRLGRRPAVTTAVSAEKSTRWIHAGLRQIMGGGKSMGNVRNTVQYYAILYCTVLHCTVL